MNKKKKLSYYNPKPDDGLFEKLNCYFSNSTEKSYEIITSDYINNMNPQKGVWALFGKRCADKKLGDWTCLQVGESEDISKELIKDIKLLYGKLKYRVPYINEWKETVFFHPVHLQSAAKWAFINIHKEYTKYVFVQISWETDRDERRRIERSFAEAFQAVYWRDGKPKGKKNAY